MAGSDRGRRRRLGAAFGRSLGGADPRVCAAVGGGAPSSSSTADRQLWRLDWTGADVNLIDFECLELRYPEFVTDLPGGAGRLVQRAGGYVATMVAGEAVVDHGELTDGRPGGLGRGTRAGR
jgi:hypothetical protein